MLTMLASLFRPRPTAAAHACYVALVAAARNPFFYTHLHVPDTFDGRFELLALHGFFLQHRLRAEAPEFARQLSELLFADLDTALREEGIGDSGVKRRITRMAKAYHGRLQVYAAALTEGDEALKATLARNLYGTVAEGNVAVLERMAAYLRSTTAQLANTPTAEITSGAFIWPAL